MDSRLTITFDPALSSMISSRASQENEKDVQSFVSGLLRYALERKAQPSATVQPAHIVISPDLQQFVGIAKHTAATDWKERKADCLTDKYSVRYEGVS